MDRIKAENRRQFHGAALREYDRQRYKENREAIRAKRAADYAVNKGGVRTAAIAYQARRYGSGCMRYRMRSAINSARARCKLRGIPFALSEEDVGTPTHCAVTGIEFNMTSSRYRNIFQPSLDRFDPKLGYVKGNVRVICHGYNLAKHTGTDADVLKLARAIVAMADGGAKT